MNNRKKTNKRGKNPRQYYAQRISAGTGIDHTTGARIYHPARTVIHLTSNQS